MKKNIQKINPKHPQKSLLLKAAAILKKGSLVAFPTETVYGLGADALNPEALRKIFIAKGRPADNPLIVHIANPNDVRKVAKNIPAVAKFLMAKFWPGPLTLVLQKKKIVPMEVSAGLHTIAVRMPAHPVALALIRAAGCPIAAPSANLSGKPSPTTAGHVVEDFGNVLELILDGGKTVIGLESTVVNVTGKRAVILRNGQITAENLEKVLGYRPRIATLQKNTKARSPGMKYRHYAPQVPLFLIDIDIDNGSPEEKLLLMAEKIAVFQKNGKRVGVLCALEHKKFLKKAEKVVVCGSLSNIKGIAKNLFDCLRKFKAKDVDVIVAEGFERKGIGIAVMDRLERAGERYQLRITN